MTQSPICTAGIFIRDGQVLLGLRNYEPKHGVTGNFWTTPGGRCDEGEDIETTLRREVLEEIGIEAFEIYRELGVVPGAKEGDEVHVFLCGANEQEKLMEPEKFAEWKWFFKDEIPENFINENVLELIKNNME